MKANGMKMDSQNNVRGDDSDYWSDDACTSFHSDTAQVNYFKLNYNPKCIITLRISANLKLKQYIILYSSF